MKKRCAWVSDDALYKNYHDEEWGKPVYDDRKLFEMLCLEGAQAGLSWITILKKRENYRHLYFNFDIKTVAGLNDAYLDSLLLEKGIIRNRLKVFGFRKNALAAQKVIKEKESLSAYFWSFVNDKPIKNTFKTIKEIPAETDISIKLSKDLKKRGFTFVGPKIIYAFMQAVGMVNDHTLNCYLRKS